MEWLRNLKIQVKLFIAFGVFIVLMFGFVAFSAIQFLSANTAFNNTVYRQINLAEAQGILALLRFNNLSTAFNYADEDLADVIAGLRNINHEALRDSFLENIHNNRENVLFDTSLTIEEKNFRLDAYYAIEFLFAEFFQSTFYDIQEGVNTDNRELIKQGLANSYESASNITAKLNDLYSIISNITEVKTSTISRNIQRIMYSLFIVAGCILILSVCVSIYIGKMITTPIASMEKAMEEISSGDLTYPIRSDYKDELGALSNRIGDMVDDIAEMNKAIAVIDYLETLIYVVDFDYNLVYLNRRLANAFRVNRDNIKREKCYKALRKRGTPCETCRLPRLFLNKATFPSVNFDNTWDSELNIWTGGRASIIRWTDGSTVYCQTINDESLKKEYEENLRKAVKDAETASVMKTTFLANMSHEIRTPMNSIVGFSELALDDDISDKTRNFLTKIMVNSELLLQVINDILDVSKIESGKMELERISFDLHELFNTIRIIITPKAEEKGIELQFYAEPSVGRKLIGDPVRLRQVLLNILSNAVKFTNTGGIVKISATVTLPEVSALPNSSINIEFEIKDTGIGMTAEQIEKIAKPFVQAETGITRRYGGTGLGLAISKNIIELMGGTLNIESTHGIGSKFSFAITFDTVESPKNIVDDKYKYDDIEKPLFDGEVLVCEDNHANQQMICEHLSRVGLKTDLAENGREGLNLVKRRTNRNEKPYDLILMDIHMPVMDGVEAAKKINELKTGTPIIALTANVMTHDRERYLRSGMQACLGKPFVSQELWHYLLKFINPVKGQTHNNIESARDDEKLLHALMVNFIKDNQDIHAEIVSAIETGNIKLASALAYTLKSNAELLGKSDLEKIAENIESLLKANLQEGHLFENAENPVSMEDLGILETELNVVLAELKQLVNA